MPSENLIGADGVLDVRALPCSVKHPLLVRTFVELPAGGYFILVNDHDPAQLRSQFAAQWPGAFTWEYLAQEPEHFRVKITKLQPLGEPAVPVATRCDGQ
jgi:uncharacterized protein (DUF2249 family)